MPLPHLNEYLSYGKIPILYRHNREGLRAYYSPNWVKLSEIHNYDNLDLRSVYVRTDHVRLVDPELTFTTTTERISLYFYYKCKGKEVHIPGFIVRDNNNGNIYLPQNCYIST
uniref:Uncharacterized protein n=1 Tax=Panagrolaimus superbus TaxID=310955 RepID=A0A914ZD64_9BILA